MSSLHCPNYLDASDQSIPNGPHDFEYAESKMIFCVACGEVRELDPAAALPAAPAAPQPSPVATGPRPRFGNGILP